MRGIAQLGSAPASGAGGREFKSRYPDRISFVIPAPAYAGAGCGGNQLPQDGECRWRKVPSN